MSTTMPVSKAKKQPSTQRNRLFAGPAGLLIMICFFLPWMTVSCDGSDIMTVSGYEIAVGDFDGYENDAEQMGETGSGVYFLFPAIGFLALGAAIVFGAKARSFYFFIGISGLLLLLGEMFFDQSEIHNYRAEGYNFGIEYEIGWWITLISLAAIVYAGYLAGDEQSSSIDDNY